VVLRAVRGDPFEGFRDKTRKRLSLSLTTQSRFILSIGDRITDTVFSRKLEEPIRQSFVQGEPYVIVSHMNTVTAL
jgi:hypothetical protein